MEEEEQTGGRDTRLGGTERKGNDTDYGKGKEGDGRIEMNKK